MPITAIRVQDAQTQEWFNWDNGVWDKQPAASGGVYVAFYHVNHSNAAVVTTLNLTRADGTVLATKTTTIPAMEGDGLETNLEAEETLVCEAWTGDILLDTVTFKISKTLDTNTILLIAGGAVIAIAVAYVAFK